MSLLDVSQGFWFGLGFAPFVSLSWVCLRLLDRTVFRSVDLDSDAREKNAFERGFQDGLKSRWIEQMNERLDDSLNEKLADIRSSSDRIRERESRPGPHA